MTIIEYVIGGIFLAFVAIMASLHHPNRGKSYEQKRDETYAHYEKRMEEFRETEAKGDDSPAEE